MKVTFKRIVRVLFNHVQKEIGKKFPEMKHKAIGGFFFLRFVCPALVTPEKFGLPKGENNFS